MCQGAPSQLLPTARLTAVLAVARPGELLGVWARGGRRALRLRVNRRALLIGADLGALLRRCNRIAIRYRGRAVVVEAEGLIAWRTLRIVTGTPYLLELERLRFLVPDLEVSGTRLTLPLGLGGPEEALAACIAARVPVVASWIEYRG
jgi:hypothetical protein